MQLVLGRSDDAVDGGLDETCFSNRRLEKLVGYFLCIERIGEDSSSRVGSYRL